MELETLVTLCAQYLTEMFSSYIFNIFFQNFKGKWDPQCLLNLNLSTAYTMYFWLIKIVIIFVSISV